VYNAFVWDINIQLRHTIASSSFLRCPVHYQGGPFGEHCQLTKEEFWHKADNFFCRASLLHKHFAQNTYSSHRTDLNCRTSVVSS